MNDTAPDRNQGGEYSLLLLRTLNVVAMVSWARRCAPIEPRSESKFIETKASSLSDLKLRQAAKCKTARRLATDRGEKACFGHQ